MAKDREKVIARLSEHVGQPVYIASKIGGQVVGGDGVLAEVMIPTTPGDRIRVRFNDGRTFAIYENSELDVHSISEDVAEKGAKDESLSPEAGDGEETDTAREWREAKEAGEDPTDTSRKAKKTGTKVKVKKASK